MESLLKLPVYLKWLNIKLSFSTKNCFKFLMRVDSSILLHACTLTSSNCRCTTIWMSLSTKLFVVSQLNVQIFRFFNVDTQKSTVFVKGSRRTLHTLTDIFKIRFFSDLKRVSFLFLFAFIFSNSYAIIMLNHVTGNVTCNCVMRWSYLCWNSINLSYTLVVA